MYGNKATFIYKAHFVQRQVNVRHRRNTCCSDKNPPLVLLGLLRIVNTSCSLDIIQVYFMHARTLHVLSNTHVIVHVLMEGETYEEHANSTKKGLTTEPPLRPLV